MYICIYICRKEGNVLFNDALNTFYLRLYGVRHMVKDHSDSERGHLMPPHGQLFPINSMGCLFYMHHLTDRIAYTTAFVALAGTRNSSMGPPHEGSIRRPIAPWANALTTELHVARMYICMHVIVYVYMYVCMYVRMYICIDDTTRSLELWIITTDSVWWTYNNILCTIHTTTNNQQTNPKVFLEENTELVIF